MFRIIVSLRNVGEVIVAPTYDKLTHCLEVIDIMCQHNGDSAVVINVDVMSIVKFTRVNGKLT